MAATTTTAASAVALATTTRTIPVTAPASEIDQLLEILGWIGFSSEPDRRAICDDAFTTYEDLFSLREKDITELSEAFGRRTQTNGKFTSE